MEGDSKTSVTQGSEQPHHNQTSDQSQFLPQHGEYRVAMPGRKEPFLLA